MIYILVGVSVALFFQLVILFLLMRHDKKQEGKLDEENDDLKHVTKTQREQLEAAAAPPVPLSGIIKRMLDEKL